MKIIRTENLKNWRSSREVISLGKAEFRPDTESGVGNAIDFFPEGSFFGEGRDNLQESPSCTNTESLLCASSRVR